MLIVSYCVYSLRSEARFAARMFPILLLSVCVFAPYSPPVAGQLAAADGALLALLRVLKVLAVSASESRTAAVFAGPIFRSSAAVSGFVSATPRKERNARMLYTF